MFSKSVRIVMALMLLTVVSTLSVMAAPAAQSPRTIRVDQVDMAEYPQITLYLSVLDADGNPVEGLRRSDFEIVEDGRSANIVDFAGLGESRPVDIIFVLDTTGSMGSYIDGIKETAIAFAETLEQRNRDYRLGLVTFGDEVRESHPFTRKVGEFTDWISVQWADGGGNDPENPLGALQHAAGFEFRSEAQRVTILITDAAAHQYGDPIDEETYFDDPNLTVERTISRLNEGSISVYTVAPGHTEYRALTEGTGGDYYSIASDFRDIIDRLGSALANQYRVTYRSPRPAFDGSARPLDVAVSGVTGSSSYVAPSEGTPGVGAVEFYNALRTPLEISTDPAVLGTNLSLAALLALLFGLTSTLFNDTLNEHGDEINSSWLGRIFSLFKRMGARLDSLFGTASRGRRVLRILQIVLFLVLTALIACYLEPAFNPLSWAGVGLFVSMLLSVGLVNLAYEGSQVWRARRFQLDAFLQLYPAGVIVALICVFFSRLVGFVPGYLYGVPGGYALGAAVSLGKRREAAIAGTGLGAAGLLALLAWGLTLLTAWLQESLGAAGVSGFLRGTVGGLQSLLLTIFFVGLEIVFLELFPMGPTNGTTIFRWNKVVWGVAFGLVAFAAFHTLFTPESAYLESVRSHSLLLLLGLLALYSLLTVVLWLFFERRGKQEILALCTACGFQNSSGAGFCTQCGKNLSVQLKGSRRGLVTVIIMVALWLVIGGAVLLAALGVG